MLLKYILKYKQNKFIQFKHYFLKLTSVSPCQNCEQISDLPTSQLHSPNPEGENTEPAPIIESIGMKSTHHPQQFLLMDDDQAN